LLVRKNRGSGPFRTQGISDGKQQRQIAPGCPSGSAPSGRRFPRKGNRRRPRPGQGKGVPSMRKGFLGSLGLMLTGAGLAFSQIPYGYAPPNQPYAPTSGYYGPSYSAGYGYGYAPGYSVTAAPAAPAAPIPPPSNPDIVPTGAVVPG